MQTEWFDGVDQTERRSLVKAPMAINHKHFAANDLTHGSYSFKPSLHVAGRRSAAAAAQCDLVEGRNFYGSVTFIDRVTRTRGESSGRAVNCAAVDVGIQRDRTPDIAAQKGRKGDSQFASCGVMPSLVKSTAYSGIGNVCRGSVARRRRLA